MIVFGTATMIAPYHTLAMMRLISPGFVLLAVAVVVIALLLGRHRRWGMFALVACVCMLCASLFLFMPAGRSHLAAHSLSIDSPSGVARSVAVTVPTEVPVDVVVNAPRLGGECEETLTVKAAHSSAVIMPAEARRTTTGREMIVEAPSDVEPREIEVHRSWVTEGGVVTEEWPSPPASPQKNVRVRTAPLSPKWWTPTSSGRPLPVSWTLISALALAAMVYLAYLFLDAGTRGQLTWTLRVISVLGFLAICGFLVLYGRLW